MGPPSVHRSVTITDNSDELRGYDGLRSLIMPTQFPLGHHRRLNPLTSQIIPHPNQDLLPDPNHSSVDEPHRKEGNDCCCGESRHQHLFQYGYEGGRTLGRRLGGSLWIWCRSHFLLVQLAVSLRLKKSQDWLTPNVDRD